MQHGNNTQQTHGQNKNPKISASHLDINTWAHIFSFIPLEEHKHLARVCILFKLATEIPTFGEVQDWNIPNAYTKQHLAMLQKRFTQLSQQIELDRKQVRKKISFSILQQPEFGPEFYLEYLCITVQLAALSKHSQPAWNLTINEACLLFTEKVRRTYVTGIDIADYVLKACTKLILLGYTTITERLLIALETLLSKQDNNVAKNRFKLELQSLKHSLVFKTQTPEALNSLYEENLQVIKSYAQETPGSIVVQTFFGLPSSLDAYFYLCLAHAQLLQHLGHFAAAQTAIKIAWNYKMTGITEYFSSNYVAREHAYENILRNQHLFQGEYQQVLEISYHEPSKKDIHASAFYLEALEQRALAYLYLQDFASAKASLETAMTFLQQQHDFYIYELQRLTQKLKLYHSIATTGGIAIYLQQKETEIERLAKAGLFIEALELLDGLQKNMLTLYYKPEIINNLKQKYNLYTEISTAGSLNNYLHSLETKATDSAKGGELQEALVVLQLAQDLLNRVEFKELFSTDTHIQLQQKYNLYLKPAQFNNFEHYETLMKEAANNACAAQGYQEAINLYQELLDLYTDFGFEFKQKQVESLITDCAAKLSDGSSAVATVFKPNIDKSANTDNEDTKTQNI